MKCIVSDLHVGAVNVGMQCINELLDLLHLTCIHLIVCTVTDTIDISLSFQARHLYLLLVVVVVVVVVN